MSEVSSLSFSAAVDEWCKKAEGRMTAVFKESTQRVFSLAANAVPIDTGYARASVRASLSSMPPINPRSRPERSRKADEARGSLYKFDPQGVVLTINGAQLGQTIYIGWTAAYVLYLEYGSSMQAPLGFVRVAAAQWQPIVNQVVKEAKLRSSN